MTSSTIFPQRLHLILLHCNIQNKEIEMGIMVLTTDVFNFHQSCHLLLYVCVRERMTPCDPIQYTDLCNYHHNQYKNCPILTKELPHADPCCSMPIKPLATSDLVSDATALSF